MEILTQEFKDRVLKHAEEADHIGCACMTVLQQCTYENSDIALFHIAAYECVNDQLYSNILNAGIANLARNLVESTKKSSSDEPDSPDVS